MSGSFSLGISALTFEKWWGIAQPNWHMFAPKNPRWFGKNPLSDPDKKNILLKPVFLWLLVFGEVDRSLYRF